ncbi:hypothetical protein ACLKA7_004265 [Drosophila subpalustris]
MLAGRARLSCKDKEGGPGSGTGDIKPCFDLVSADDFVVVAKCCLSMGQKSLLFVIVCCKCFKLQLQLQQLLD